MAIKTRPTLPKDIARPGSIRSRGGEAPAEALKKAPSTEPTTQKAPAPGARGPAKDAFDDAGHLLEQNPYSFDAGGQTPISNDRIQAFDRLGLGAMNAVSARIAMMTGAGGAKASGKAAVDSGAILESVAQHPHLKGPIADGIPSVEALMPPITDFAGARAKTVDALANFSVTRADGTAPMSLLEKIEGSNLSDHQVARAIDVFTEFQHSLGLRDFDPGSSDINWKHVCGEAAQVIDAAAKQGLSPAQTEVALLASLFSDAVKFPATLLTHNIDGAIGAFHVMNRRGDLDKDTMAAVISATKEHQVGPPSFMAMLTGFRLHGVKDSVKLDGGEDANALIESIQMKMSTPLDPAHVQTSGGASKIAFTANEQKLMTAAGVDEWAVPSPKAPWFEASMAVITGDSLVNYAMPEGVGKIVALSGPGTMFKNPTVFDSMFSNGTSFLDARSLLPKGFQELADQGAELTKRGIDQVRQSVGEKLASGKLEFPAAEFDAILAQETVDIAPLTLSRSGDTVRVDVPGDGTDVPYFHRALDFEAGEVEGKGPDANYEFAKLIRRTVADELRDLSPSSLADKGGA